MGLPYLLPLPFDRHGEQLVGPLQPRHPSGRFIKELLHRRVGNKKKKRENKGRATQQNVKRPCLPQKQ